MNAVIATAHDSWIEGECSKEWNFEFDSGGCSACLLYTSDAADE